MRLTKWIKKRKQNKKILKNVEGVLTGRELKSWLADETTLKFVTLLKILRRQQIEALMHNPKDKEVLIGFCQGYQSMINLLENTIASVQSEGELPEDELRDITESNLKDLVDVYLSNLNINDNE